MSNPIKLAEINPFVRHVHIFVPKSLSSLQPRTTCDARCFLVTRGELELLLSTSSVQIEAGQMILLPAGTCYGFSATDDAEVLGINFDYTQQGAHQKAPISPLMPDRFQDADLTERAVIEDCPELGRPFCVRNALGLLALAGEIEAEYSSDRALSEGILSAKMKLLILGAVESSHSDSKSSETVDRVISYLRAHCTEHITNLDVGRALNFHPNYLNRLIRSHTGKSLHAYLTHCRVNHAIRMLQTTSASISEIATASGFGDVQQFSKVFRQITGHTPGVFRKAFV